MAKIADPETRRAFNRRRRIKLEAKLTARTAEQVVADALRMHPDGTKLCRRCGRYRALVNFTASLTQLDGLSFLCDDCWAERQAVGA